jgi:hypothetical protein
MALCGATGVAGADGARDPVGLDAMDDAFGIKVTNGKARLGQEGTVMVTVSAKAGYHCNEKYPHKIKDLSVSAGAELPSKDVPGVIQDNQVVFKVPVKVVKTGVHTVAGQIRFSVCNASQCLIKKVPLSASVKST